MARTQINADTEINWPSWAAGAVLLGAGGDATPTALAPGPAGNVLTSDGSAWASQAPAGGSGVETVTVTAATTLTLSTSSTSITDYVYTGAVAATWTLPPVAGNAGKRINIENAGTAAAAVITLNRAGTDNIWFLNTLTSVLVAQGGSMLLLCDGTYWQVLSTDLAHDAVGILPIANGGTGVATTPIDGSSFITLTAARTLTSQTAAQKAFNVPTNGALTIGVGTYFFEYHFSLTGMSSTSASFGFALGGTIVLGGSQWVALAGKFAFATSQNTGMVSGNGTALPASTAVTGAGTATVGNCFVTGKLRITTAGTLIPEISLGVAAAAVVGADAYFRIWPAGSQTVQSVGAWS